MNPDKENIEIYLEGKDTKEQKIDTCWEILALQKAQPWVQAKAATWLAYRALEKPNTEILKGQISESSRVLDNLVNEKGKFLKNRWTCSGTMVLAYLQIAAYENALPTLWKLSDMNLVNFDPKCSVNMCRAMALATALEAKSGNFGKAQRATETCHKIFRESSQTRKLIGVANCEGHELVQAARAVHVTVALLPHSKMEFNGTVYGKDTILAIEPYTFFKSALEKCLPPSCLSR